MSLGASTPWAVLLALVAVAGTGPAWLLAALGGGVAPWGAAVSGLALLASRQTTDRRWQRALGLIAAVSWVGDVLAAVAVIVVGVVVERTARQARGGVLSLAALLAGWAALTWVWGPVGAAWLLAAVLGVGAGATVSAAAISLLLLSVLPPALAVVAARPAPDGLLLPAAAVVGAAWVGAAPPGWRSDVLWVGLVWLAERALGPGAGLLIGAGAGLASVRGDEAASRRAALAGVAGLLIARFGL